MGKDPAFLFYPNDWIGGTMGMTFEEKGCYMELLMLQFNNGRFTKKQAERVLNESFKSVWENIRNKFLTDGNVFWNKRLEEEKEKRIQYTESRRISRTKSHEDNVRIYLLKDNDSGYIKIGSSVNPLRRYNEITNQTISVIGSSESRNYDLIWYSGVVKRSKETELHNYFKMKNIQGEWYDLKITDIDMIQRTLPRTENEDENINENKNKKRGEFEGGNRTRFTDNFESFFYEYHKITELGEADKEEAYLAWKDLSQDEQLKAMKKIVDYFNWADRNYLKMAKNYLKHKAFNNDFSKPQKYSDESISYTETIRRQLIKQMAKKGLDVDGNPLKK